MKQLVEVTRLATASEQTHYRFDTQSDIPVKSRTHSFRTASTGGSAELPLNADAGLPPLLLFGRLGLLQLLSLLARSLLGFLVEAPGRLNDARRVVTAKVEQGHLEALLRKPPFTIFVLKPLLVHLTPAAVVLLKGGAVGAERP